MNKACWALLVLFAAHAMNRDTKDLSPCNLLTTHGIDSTEFQARTKICSETDTHEQKQTYEHAKATLKCENMGKSIRLVHL